MTTRIVTLAGFALIAIAGVWFSLISARRSDLMTLPQLLSRVTDSRAVRLLSVLVWAWLGWHLFARGSGAFE